MIFWRNIHREIHQFSKAWENAQKLKMIQKFAWNVTIFLSILLLHYKMAYETHERRKYFSHKGLQRKYRMINSWFFLLIYFKVKCIMWYFCKFESISFKNIIFPIRNKAPKKKLWITHIDNSKIMKNCSISKKSLKNFSNLKFLFLIYK